MNIDFNLLETNLLIMEHKPHSNSRVDRNVIIVSYILLKLKNTGKAGKLQTRMETI